MEITYVVSRWGEPTQTFVRREAEALQGRGICVRALSLRPLGASGTSTQAVSLGPIRILGGLLRALFQQPSVMFVLWTVIRNASRGNMLAHLTAAAIGISWAGNRLLAGDLIHAHFGWVGATAAWAAARTTGMPFSVVLHAFELHTRSRIDGFSVIPLREAEEVFVISDRDRDVVRERWDIQATRLRMGVPGSWLSMDGPRREWQILSVGALRKKKGHHILLNALAICDPKWNLDIIGDGPEMDHLEALVTKLELSERVRFRGALPEAAVQQALQSATAFCLASTIDASGDRDGVPVALIEAMAAGLPVVATDVGGVPELVDGAGIVVGADDASGLAEAFDQLRDPAVRAHLAGLAQERVRDEYLVEDTCQPVVSLLSRVS